MIGATIKYSRTYVLYLDGETSMLLYTAMLLFLLLAVELSYTAKKSTQEAYFAFLSSRMQSSKQQALSEKLQQLLKMKDMKNFQVVLNEAGLIKGTEQKLEDLESLEATMTEDFEHRYNTILHYLPDDLKEFFEAYKIVWDLENIKLLLHCIINLRDSENCSRLIGPFGHIDSKSIRELAKYRIPTKMLEKSRELLPVDVASRMKFEKNMSLRDFGFALDFAAFEHLKKRSEEIDTKNVRLAWAFLKNLYEVENLAVMARLKHSEVPSEQIASYLFPVQGKLDDSDLKRLLDAENYSAFLHALKNTPYREYIRNENPNPMDVEEALKEGVYKLSFGKTKDIDAEMIVRFLFNVETQYKTIRKMAFYGRIGDLER